MKSEARMKKIMDIIFPSMGTRVGIGIIAAVALILALTIAGINYLTQVNLRMKDIVETNNVKMEMAHVMQNTLRERAINMYNLTILDNDYLKNEEYRRFNIFGASFAKAQQALEDVASTGEEKAILARIRALSAKIDLDEQDVVGLLLKGRAHYAYDEAIHKRIIPQQNKISEQVAELMALQNGHTTAVVKSAELSYQYARKLMLTLGFVASALLILIAVLVSRKVSRQAQDMEHQALHDELTNLPNRMLFLDRMAHAISRSQRESVPFSIMLLDLDRFKAVNDTLGHDRGDQLLQEVSCRLCDAVRDSDTVARLGGDEFVVLMEQIDLEYAPLIANKIIEVLEHPFVLGGQVVDMSASIGIVYFPDHGEDSVTLLQKADMAMYAAKRNHSSFEIYTGALAQNSRADLAYRSELLQAIECDELALYFQPKIDLRSGKIISVEALVRWQHPQRGFLPPDEFIPQAEQTGLINPLTFWVLKKALQQCAVFNKAGIDITVAVNLSAVSLNDIRIPGEIAHMLANARIKPSMLVLEITESGVMSNPAEALNVLQILDKMGVSLAIDDFGTGYSSLAYLSKLPVDEIKIDKSFVLDMELDPQAAVIVRSTIELGHNLGKKVVAEGVESLALWNLLLEWGCDTAQGYYMSQPLPADKLMQWLEESQWG